MAIRADGRHVLNLTVKPDLYKKVKQHCQDLDVPVTAWVRDIIKKEIQRNE